MEDIQSIVELLTGSGLSAIFAYLYYTEKKDHDATTREYLEHLKEENEKRHCEHAVNEKSEEQ